MSITFSGDFQGLFLKEFYSFTVQIRPTRSGSCDETNHRILMKQISLDSQHVEELTPLKSSLLIDK